MVTLIKTVDTNQLNSSDTFFLDTNVLCAVHFQTSWNQNKIDTYSSFLQTLLMKDITVYVSALSLQEFYHLIKKKEHEFYETVNGKISKKNYRKIVSERNRIANELKMIHQQIVGQYTVVGGLMYIVTISGTPASKRSQAQPLPFPRRLRCNTVMLHVFSLVGGKCKSQCH